MELDHSGKHLRAPFAQDPKTEKRWQTCGTWQTNPQKVLFLAYHKRDKQQYIHYLPYLPDISHVNPDPSLKNKPKPGNPEGGLGPEGLGLGSPPLMGGLWSADPPSRWKASESALPITEIVPFKRLVCPSAKEYKRGKNVSDHREIAWQV